MKVLRARRVVPVAEEPIENGAVVVDQGRIAAVGPYDRVRRSHKPARSKVEDLGESLLAPGLVNAHCHLNYTGMAGAIPPPASFTQWIHAVLKLRETWKDADYARSRKEGADMLVRSGTTTVVDFDSTPHVKPVAAKGPAPRTHCLIELTNVSDSESVPNLLSRADKHAKRLEAKMESVGYAPHAPYSTSMELLRGVAERLASSKRLCAIHVGESGEEFDMWRRRTGPLFDWLAKSRDMGDLGRRTPVEHVDRSGLFDRGAIAVHANCVTGRDIPLLAAKNVSVVHCPRTHDYFGHPRLKSEAMTRAGVNICLGTDSLLTVRAGKKEKTSLDMFEEMRLFQVGNPHMTPEDVLRMATVNGAKAIGREGRLGALVKDAAADMIVIPDADPAADAHAAITRFTGRPARVMIGGDWVC